MNKWKTLTFQGEMTYLDIHTGQNRELTAHHRTREARRTTHMEVATVNKFKIPCLIVRRIHKIKIISTSIYGLSVSKVESCSIIGKDFVESNGQFVSNGLVSKYQFTVAIGNSKSY